MEEDPIGDIKAMIYDLMDLAVLDTLDDPERKEYSDNTMSFLKAIEEELDKLGAST